jgi:pyruvate carboxylase
MPDQSRTSPRILQTLNELPMSQHVLELMKNEHVSAQPGLAVLSLLLWAQENMPIDFWRMETVIGLAARAEMDDPEALMENLRDAEPNLLEATTLEDAAMALLRLLADLIPAA